MSFLKTYFIRTAITVIIALYIEHCIIGETFFFASSPILGAFYNNEKKYFVYW